MPSSHYRSPLNSKNKEPTVQHKFTSEEYKTAKTTVFKAINKISDKISPVCNPVKRRVLTMAIKNITDSIDLYFDEKTYRTNPRQDKIFARASQEVSNIVQFLPVSKDRLELIEWVEKEISKINVQFREQHAYLKIIEEQVHALRKTTPSANPEW